MDVDALHRVELFSHDHGWSAITDLLLVLKGTGVGSLILGLDDAVGTQRHKVVENSDIGLGLHQSELSEKWVQANESSVVTDHHRVDTDRASHVNGLTLVGMSEVDLVVLTVHILLTGRHRLCAIEVALMLIDNSKAILGHARLQNALGECEVEVGVVEDLQNLHMKVVETVLHRHQSVADEDVLEGVCVKHYFSLGIGAGSGAPS